MPKFSVIIPVYSELDPLQGGASTQRHFRYLQVQRAIKSILHQQFTDWELIIVDDGCVDGMTPDMLDKFAENPKVKVIHQANQNRAIARNNGMDAATGEWICWLDSDDEYSTHYLREIDRATKDFPEYNLFNFGSIIHFPDHHTAIRSVYPFDVREDGLGHEWFRSGHIGCGSFVFKRDVWASSPKYRIPDQENPFQFAAESRFDMRYTPEHSDWNNIDEPAGAFTDGVYRQGLSLGNPWGDDFLQFYLLTRDNLSKPLDVLLYIQYPRAHEEIYEEFGEIYEAY